MSLNRDTSFSGRMVPSASSAQSAVKPSAPSPLPCPFCGFSPELWSKGTPCVDYVGCKQKGCPAKPKVGTTAGHVLAIAGWNRRYKLHADNNPAESIENDTMNDAQSIKVQE